MGRATAQLIRELEAKGYKVQLLWYPSSEPEPVPNPELLERVKKSPLDAASHSTSERDLRRHRLEVSW